MRKFLLLVFTIIFTSGLLVACDEANVEEVDKEQSDDAEAAEKEKEEKLAVGDTVSFDDMEITLNEARIEEGGEFDEPEEDQFVVANLTIKNKTEEEQTVSSIMNIELKDDDGYGYTTTILTEGIKGQLDGSIEPGGDMRGEIPFDVSESENYELHFSDPFKSGKAIWNISSEELQ